MTVKVLLGVAKNTDFCGEPKKNQPVADHARDTLFVVAHAGIPVHRPHMQRAAITEPSHHPPHDDDGSDLTTNSQSVLTCRLSE